jgi:hypothetical protein
MKHKENLLNDFAIRSFRDVGDYDYIAARMAFRTTLFAQFLWSGLQAIEKYLKCILLLNRVKRPKGKQIGHDLAAALERVDNFVGFQLQLSDSSRKLIEHLDTYGRFRYLETPYNVFGNQIIQFDKTVWEMRRYCIPVFGDEMVRPQYDHLFGLIKRSELNRPTDFKIFNGALEKVISDNKHPAHEALVWNNLFFGKRSRKSVKIPQFFSGVNSPLSLHPELLNEVDLYVFLQLEIKDAYQKIAADKSETK